MPEGHGSVGACGSSQTTFSTGVRPFDGPKEDVPVLLLEGSITVVTIEQGWNGLLGPVGP
jgi:hypothetical protein